MCTVQSGRLPSCVYQEKRKRGGAAQIKEKSRNRVREDLGGNGGVLTGETGGAIVEKESRVRST